MPVLTRILCATMITFAVATSAFAQQGEPWNLQEGKAYVVDMQGKMKMMHHKDRCQRAWSSSRTTASST